MNAEANETVMVNEGVFRPKLLECLKGYGFSQLTGDLIAGLIVAIIALPLSIALALASGAGPEEGLYTAIAAGFVVSAFGGCKVQIAGPTAAFATIVAGIIARNGMAGLAASAFAAGLIIIVLGLFKLGKHIHKMPYPIVVGFTGGIAISILFGQLKDFFGLAYSEKPVETLDKLLCFFKHIGSTDSSTLVFASAALAVIFIWPLVPRIGKRIPAAFIAVVLGIIAVSVFKADVKTIGGLYVIRPQAPRFIVPDFRPLLDFTVLSDAVVIALLASVESLLSAKVADEMTGDRHYPNTELIAQGLGNMASAVFGGIPATGAIARTAANIKNGGKTPIAGMFHAIALLLSLLFLVPCMSLIPMPVIAAILFSVAYNMSGWRNFRNIITERVAKDKKILNIVELFATFILTICFDLIVAIIAGISIHVVAYLLHFRKGKQNLRKLFQ